MANPFASLAQAVGVAAIQSVTLRTQVSPPVTVDPFAEGPPASPAPNPFLSFVKPMIEVQTAAGRMVIAPYGEPTENYFPWLVAGAVVFFFGAVGLIGWVARRLK